jgi:hypothetical protein
MIREIITDNLIPAEDYIYGFADLKGLIDNNRFNGFCYGISIGRRLDDRIIDCIKEGPTIEYYNHYNQVNKELAGLTGRIKADLKRAGVDSIFPTKWLPQGPASDGSANLICLYPGSLAQG